MLRQLKIENFRCFKSFELNHLGRVNLFVGVNNCGKTSILEAIQLLSSENTFDSLKSIMNNRGEYNWQERNIGSGTRRAEFSLQHLFYQHEIDLEMQFLISSCNKTISLSILENAEIQQDQYRDDLDSNIIAFVKKTDQISGDEQTENYRLNEEAKLVEPKRFGYPKIIKSSPKIQFITSSSLTTQETIDLFNQIVLTSEEDLVYQALRNIEPNIERIASIISNRRTINDNSHRGFVIKLSNTEQRIPIGSMGDGVWRMLGIVLALVSAKDGVLLVDEIDTGLHYTTLEDMWKLIWETSNKLNVQVFATTHNSDCWKALETLTSREDVAEEDISIQRIEKDVPRSVAYNKEEIATAVEREIEVR